jgi:hypothetical protein
MRVGTFITAVCFAAAASAYPLAGQNQKGAPETFTANMHATGAAGGAAAATITIDVQRYTPDAERTAVETALKTGGFAGFVAALKKAPAVGAVKFGEKSWTIRWAREVKSTNKRTLTFVTDSPIFFVGGGAADAKPRAGYDVALIQLDVDDVGLGNGQMAAAARVRPGGESGVQVDDYADKPIKLTTVVRKIK